MKCINVLLRTTMKGFAVLGFSVMLATTATAQPVIKLEGEAVDVKDNYDSIVRLSILRWSEQEQAQNVVDAYMEYQNSMDPEAFQEAISEIDTVGYIFTDSPAGYSIKYAWQDPSSANDSMVLLVTPSLKSINPYMWEQGNDSDLPYTLIELSWRGSTAMAKTSLDSNIVVDDQGRLALADFNSAGLFANLQEE